MGWQAKRLKRRDDAGADESDHGDNDSDSDSGAAVIVDDDTSRCQHPHNA